MNNNKWNKATIGTAVGLLVLLIGAVAFFLVGGGLERGVPWIYMMGGVAVLILIIGVVYLVLVSKGKITQQEPDYRTLFIIGIIFMIFGISSDSGLKALFVLGLVFMGVGLANRNKWKEQPRWSELPPAQRKFKIAVLSFLIIAVLAGFVAWYLFAR